MHMYPSELYNGINNPNFNDVNHSLGLLGVYIIMPIALIIRDQLIIMYVENVFSRLSFGLSYMS